MKRGERWFHRIAEDMDVPAPALPLIEIAGTGRVLIENHGGVTGYGRDCIRVRVKYGQICISGGSLEIAKMTKDQLVISGCIQEVKLLRRDNGRCAGIL